MLFGGNLKDALAKYTGKADEIAATDTPENPSQSDINEAQEKEKQKENEHGHVQSTLEQKNGMESA